MASRAGRCRILISSSQRALRVPRKKLAELINFLADRSGADIAEIDLTVVSAKQIAGLNRKYLRHGGATDVLSFDLSEAGRRGICGQLIVCGEIAASQARARGTGPQGELMLYVVHGLLHLLGYNDHTPSAKHRMDRRQEAILQAFLESRRPQRRRKRGDQRNCGA